MSQVTRRHPLRFLLPKNDFHLETADPPSVVRAKMEAIMSEEPILDSLRALTQATLQRQPPTRAFVGGFAAEGDAFTLRPARRNRNSWRPQITGTIEPQGVGSVVHIRMRIHPLTLLIMGSMVVHFGLVLLLMVIGSMNGQPLPPLLWLTTLIPIFLYGFSLVAFWREANPAQAALEQALR